MGSGRGSCRGSDLESGLSDLRITNAMVQGACISGKWGRVWGPDNGPAWGPVLSDLQIEHVRCVFGADTASAFSSLESSGPLPTHVLEGVDGPSVPRLFSTRVLIHALGRDRSYAVRCGKKDS